MEPPATTPEKQAKSLPEDGLRPRHDLPRVASQFHLYGDFIGAEPYGSGHINDTYAAVINQGGREVRYLFQRINHNVFTEPARLMDNLARVTRHTFAKMTERNGSHDLSRRALTLITARNGNDFAVDEEGNHWRVYVFIEKARTYDTIQSTAQAFSAARAFGEFQGFLVDLPGERLFETIPDFHNTRQRFQRLQRAIADDPHNRAADAAAEIAFVNRHEALTGLVIDLMAKGEIPERITHNDCKLNNVMIDDDSNEGICVIDLDTVMPGSALYDFGDMVRTSTSPAAEDETDLSKVVMQMPMFEAITRGYLSAAGNFLNPTEIALLPAAGKLITLEIGIRFLTDFLEGDVYFKTHRTNQNLDRCRTQFRLVESIESQEAAMEAVVREASQ